MKEATEPVRALGHLQEVETVQPSPVEVLTAKAIDQRLASFTRRIQTQRERITAAEKVIAEINEEKAALINAATQRWAAQLPQEPNDS